MVTSYRKELGDFLLFITKIKINSEESPFVTGSLNIFLNTLKEVSRELYQKITNRILYVDIEEDWVFSLWGIIPKKIPNAYYSIDVGVHIASIDGKLYLYAIDPKDFYVHIREIKKDEYDHLRAFVYNRISEVYRGFSSSLRKFLEESAIEENTCRIISFLALQIELFIGKNLFELFTEKIKKGKLTEILNRIRRDLLTFGGIYQMGLQGYLEDISKDGLPYDIS